MNRYIVYFLGAMLLLAACDDINVNPSVKLLDCFTKEDSTNYELFIGNEKLTANKMGEYGYDPSTVNPDEHQALREELRSHNSFHDSLRKVFDCKSWSSEDDFIAEIVIGPAAEVDMEILDPQQYKALFKIDESMLTTLNQQDWAGREIYIFPGVSRIPWTGATESDRLETIDRINQAFRDIQAQYGVEQTDLFNTSDYIYPHASFHQLFTAHFIEAVGEDPDVNTHGQIVTDMHDIEEAIYSKFISRAPNKL